MKSYDAPETNFYEHTHTIEVTFQMWSYKHVQRVEVGGNTTGLSILDAGVQAVIDKLVQEEGSPLTMTSEDGDTLAFDFDEEGDELEECVVCAEIVEVKRAAEPVPIKWVEEKPHE